MIRRMLPLVVGMLSAAPMALAAQQQHAMHMQKSAAMGCAMHGMMPGMDDRMMNDSSAMARMHSELGLTEAQVQQLRTIHERACAAAEPHMKMAMQAHQAAMQALEGDKPSLDKYEDQLDKAAKHMVAAQVEMGKAMIEMRKNLTSAQREKMDQMHKKMMQDMH